MEKFFHLFLIFAFIFTSFFSLPVNNVIATDSYSNSPYVELHSDSSTTKVSIDKYFSSYDEPSFNSTKNTDYVPQTVTVYKTLPSGWMLIDTHLGKKWIAPDGFKMALLLPFDAYHGPSYDSRIVTGFAAQTVTVHDEKPNGWMLIDTYLGKKWIIPTEGIRKLVDREFKVYKGPTFDSTSESNFSSQSPLTLAETTDNWRLIKTYLGNRWVKAEGERSPIHHLFWVFTEPSILASKVELFSQQSVTVFDRLPNGWLLIKTYRGNHWVKPDIKGFHTIENHTYYTDETGELYTGRKYIDEKRKWYEFNNQGRLIIKTGWQTVNGKKVYHSFSDYGMLANRFTEINGITYEFDINGYLVEDQSSKDNITIGELEAQLLSYFKANNLPYKVGTPEYYTYLKTQLLEHSDLKLAKHPSYPRILVYAVEYLYERGLIEEKINSNESLSYAPFTFNMNHIAHKTIKDIENEGQQLEQELQMAQVQTQKEHEKSQQIQEQQQELIRQKQDLESKHQEQQQNLIHQKQNLENEHQEQQDTKNTQTIEEQQHDLKKIQTEEIQKIEEQQQNLKTQLQTFNASSRYNAQDAVNYALKWAWVNNPTYINWDLRGGDCANFVSQALYAGGINMREPSPLPNRTITDGDYWFGHTWRINRVSSSWINAHKFYQYWSKHVSKSETLSPMQIFHDMRPGDVLQYKSVKGGKVWHTLMVTDRDSSNKRTIYITQHTPPRKNKDYAEIDKDNSDHGDSKWVQYFFTRL
ncbi:hypothetical protein DX932_16705 [Bacillus cereus]|uniref:Putative amidase domain-containing protein n=1 Tax=Bacillus cereus TaxID=1396 RepID=A0A9W7UQX8_BACCE|nr:amidase domain-containing protein [Bacillus cereus]KAA6463479.1 hypothetical protein DX932_16705 [Bacillus cereus]KAB2506190.1 hypothetical protein F8156_00950 [Bacillus cereus]